MIDAEVFLGIKWVYIAIFKCFALFVTAGMIVYYRQVIKCRNRGLFKQIRERRRLEEQLNKALIDNLNLQKRLQTKKVL